MSSIVTKKHDHTFELDFDVNFTFTTINQTHLFDTSITGLFEGGGDGLLKLTSYSDEIFFEQYIGDYSVAADEDVIYFQNIPNNIFPESDIVALRIRIQGHSNEEMNGYHDIQIFSKSTSVIDPTNFDYSYTLPEDFSTNIPFELCSISIADNRVTEDDFKKEYQYSQDNINFSDFELFSTLNNTTYSDDCEGECSDCEIFPLNPDLPVYLRIIYTRLNTDITRSLVLNDLKFQGEHEVKIKRVGELSTLSGSNECIELVQTDIYKVFNITDYTIDSNLTDLTNFDIRFQISQDNCRSWSDWCFLSKENISAYNVDPLKFFHIKYSICTKENYTGPELKIYDIILEGSMQNVSSDYLNGGKLGLRPEIAGKSPQQGITLETGGAHYCQTVDEKFVGDTKLGTNKGDMYLSDADPNRLWNPYETMASTKLYDNLSNIVSDMFGFSVLYFPVNPDGNGIDRVIHEYQLHNSDECGEVKVMVPQNQFPDNQISFNVFGLDMFEAFEIHITKEAYKKVFGIERRPRKEDYLFFREVNRMYTVEHTQEHKEFMNASVFYKVTLKKYEQRANVRMSEGVKAAHDELTNNTTLNDLFGIEKQKEDKITSKAQYQTLSDDLVRLDINKKVLIYEEELHNASLTFSETNYDFIDVKYNDIAVTYTNADKVLNVENNRAFSFWFNFNSLNDLHKDINDEDYIFTLLDNYDEANMLGYKIYYKDLKIYFVLNDNTYTLPFTIAQKEVWYCLMINLNQCNKELDMHIFKRFTTITDGIESDARLLASSRLEQLYHKQYNVEPVSFAHTTDMVIYASNMRLTNIRVFNDIVQQKSFTKVLNQYIIKKSHFLIFADNANEKIILENHA